MRPLPPGPAAAQVAGVGKVSVDFLFLRGNRLPLAALLAWDDGAPVEPEWRKGSVVDALFAPGLARAAGLSELVAAV